MTLWLKTKLTTAKNFFDHSPLFRPTNGVFSDKGYQAMKMLIQKNDLPEAIFCFNDPTALGALKAIKDEGIKCPVDIALVGFSETELAKLVDPLLTSVKQPSYELG